MIRVLHLHAYPADSQTERLAASSRRDCAGDIQFSVRTVGRGGDFRNWFFAGTRIFSRRFETFDVLHAFDAASIKAAWSRKPTIFSPPAMTEAAIASLSAPNRRNSTVVVCSSTAEQRALSAKGPAGLASVVVPPAVERVGVPAEKRVAVRKALGFDADACVVLLPGTVDRLSGHEDALWAVSILHVLDSKFCVLVWEAGNVPALQRLAIKLGQPNLLTAAGHRLGRGLDAEALTAAADIAVFSPKGAIPLLPIAQCKAAGLPIVATQSAWLAEMLHDGVDAAIVPSNKPRLLAQRILELHADRPQREKLAAAAKLQATRAFSLERAARAFHELYSRCSRGPAGPGGKADAQRDRKTGR